MRSGRDAAALGKAARARFENAPGAAAGDGSMNDVTRILSSVDQGDTGAAEQLLPLVYDELRKLAAARLASESPGQTLDATALVHEAYLRLVGPTNDHAFANRKHFFVAASEAMRRILVENARRKHRAKRGGKLRRVELEGDALEAPKRDERVLALDEALERFAAIEPAKAELLKLHSFGGLSLAAAAELLGISPTTADRWWAYARAWLRTEISEQKQP
jgi:RNA polymerase sigma factor (TIGR02999 family)